mmetsp:Transcript_25794/g.44035  ORF Transcript_25794/g.44035 Transcript_25794/m.44035 type:complete len:135 (+) Transcript_25794:253-657(+)
MDPNHDTSKSAIVLDSLTVEQFLKLQQLLQRHSEIQDGNINVFLCMETTPPLSLATRRSIIAAALKATRSNSGSLDVSSSSNARCSVAPASSFSSTDGSASARTLSKANRRSMPMKAIGSLRSLKARMGYSKLS